MSVHAAHPGTTLAATVMCLWRTHLLRLWLLLAPLYALQVYLHYAAIGPQVEPGRAAAIAVQDAALWWLLSPVVALAWLHRRWSASRACDLALHAGLAATVALLHALLDAALGTALRHLAGGQADFAGLLGYLLPTTFGLNLLLYAVQIGWLALWDRTPPARVEADAASPTDALVLRDGARRVRIPLADIRRVDAAGNYVAIAHAGGTEVARMPLAEVERRVAGTAIVRVHRSTLVNLAHARELVVLAHGDARLHLDDGSEVKVSRRYRAQVERQVAPG